MKEINLTWDDVCELVETLTFKIKLDGWIPNVVVGITRGGLLPGKMISHNLNVEMASLDVSLRDSKLGQLVPPNSNQYLPSLINEGKRILIVDDINDTGSTFNWIKHDWQQTIQFIDGFIDDVWPTDFIRFAALVHNEPSSEPTDYWGRSINKQQDPSWVVFPWENWHQKNQ